MAQKMTEENKPFVMATLSGVAYKDPEEASKTFEQFRFTEHKSHIKTQRKRVRLLNNLDLQNTSILTEMVLNVI